MERGSMLTNLEEHIKRLNAYAYQPTPHEFYVEIDGLKRLVIELQADIDKQISEIIRLKKILKTQIMVYQVDDQAWDKEEAANRILDRLLND